jgi:threonine/homoserine/homoserine lactone efflux protein
MNELTIFLFATGLSLYGSLMAGLVNVNVIYTALHKSKREAKLMALGGVIPEVLYSGIAIYGVNILQTNETLFEALKYAAVPILFGMGLFFFLQKPKEIKEDTSAKTSFYKGLFLALLNPQLITFWLGWLIIGVSADYFDLHTFTYISPKLTFMLGTAVGAYISLRIFIYIAVRNREKIKKWLKINVNVLVGLILMGLALLQLALVLWQRFG